MEESNILTGTIYDPLGLDDLGNGDVGKAFNPYELNSDEEYMTENEYGEAEVPLPNL